MKKHLMLFMLVNFSLNTYQYSYCQEYEKIVKENSEELIKLVRDNNFKAVEVFLKREKDNIDINALDQFGYNSLMWASRKGNEDLVNLLIANGAHLNILNKGCSALMYSVVWKHDNISKLLIDNGALIDNPQGSLKRLLELAVHNGLHETAELLKSRLNNM